MGKPAGKVYTNDEIVKLYGDLKHSHIVKTSLLQKAAEECGEYVFFNISGGNLLIAKDVSGIIAPMEFHVFSTEILKNFLNKVDLDSSIEEHSELQIWSEDYTFVIKNGAHSLQKAHQCPPFCPPYVK